MPLHTELTRRLAISHPIIQAPMAGGGDTPTLVAAVSAAGGLGSIGAAYLTAPEIAESARAVRARTDRPFAVNLFAPQPAADPPDDVGPALRRVAPFFAELGLDPPSPPEQAADGFEDQFAAALETGASVFSFTFGIPPAVAITAIKRRGMMLVGTATTVEEAGALAVAGFDAVVAQGSEAGGHRATFMTDFDRAMIGTMALVPQLVDQLTIPVIASGGIMDGRGIAASLALGAAAAQLGTAFLTTEEAGVPDAYKAAILGAGASDTRLTRAFSGRPARGIVNRFMTVVGAGDTGGSDDAILPFPHQNTLTRPLRRAAAGQGRADLLSLWAGQGLGLAQPRPAAELVARLAAETDAAIERLGRED